MASSGVLELQVGFVGIYCCVLMLVAVLSKQEKNALAEQHTSTATHICKMHFIKHQMPTSTSLYLRRNTTAFLILCMRVCMCVHTHATVCVNAYVLMYVHGRVCVYVCGFH